MLGVRSVSWSRLSLPAFAFAFALAVSAAVLVPLACGSDPESTFRPEPDSGSSSGTSGGPFGETETYPLDFFFAERHAGGSNVLFQTTLALRPAGVK